MSTILELLAKSISGSCELPLVRKMTAILGMIAVSVVVRCGDDDDDEEREEERRSMLMLGVHEEAAAAHDGLLMTEALDGIRLAIPGRGKRSPASRFSV
ncbi:MAG: hypothetical protein ACR2RA_03315 [Geminicoccaceae bacterium]